MKLSEIDLTDLDFFLTGDPHEAWRTLRREAPVFWHEKRGRRGFWAVTRYADVLGVYHNPTVYSSERGIALNMLSMPMAETAGGMGQMMIMSDPPRHGQMRSLINRRLTPRAVDTYEPNIRRIAIDIIDGVIARGECDFVVDVAAKLPTAVICEMMNIPREHWEMMFNLGNMSIGTDDPEYQQGRSAQETGMAAQAEVFSYFSKVIAERRRQEGSDLISALIHGEVGGAPLSDLEILFNCFLFIVGGQETTRNATSGGLLALIQHPAQFAKLKADPDVTPTAIEEFLRWTSPVTHVMRTAKQEIVLNGQTIKAGDPVVLWNASANRDESAFSNPDVFDISRSPNDHLAFGHGEHFCVGANLARLELRVMIDEVIRRMRDIELAGPVERLRSNFVAGIKHMPIRFRPAEPLARAA
ncbi:MAG TPA: cytochrome P450 [Candidatus Binataceae bacterium]|nr:cytochrome P450 [Candidatus Binataceae bacterium]